MSLLPVRQSTVADVIVASLVEAGVTQVWGVVGDALNPVTDAIRRTEGIEWIGVRHEEAAAFAASAQAQLTGRLAVCMGTVGPGAIHLLNGLYDAKKSHAPVLAITGQVPTEHIGTQFFQEVDNDKLFADVALMAHTITNPAQVRPIISEAVNMAYGRRGVSVLTLPGDVGDLPMETPEPATFSPVSAGGAAAETQVTEALSVLNDESKKVALLVGCGAAGARDHVLETARRLMAPMVITLKAKPVLEQENEFQVGQTGLIGNPGAVKALDECDVLFMVGTDFPYTDWYPHGKTVIQLDRHQETIGRRVPVAHALVGDAADTLAALNTRLNTRSDSTLLDSSRAAFQQWKQAQARLADPEHDERLLGRIRAVLDNPDSRIRPEAVAVALDRLAPSDAIFTADTGMSTVWLSRFIEMTGSRDMVGSFNLGSMANALPMALGAQALDRHRTVVALCGDGGLMMLLGDLRTAVTYRLPVVFVVFNNGRLGMVKLEQEQGGLPEFGTELDNPDFAAVGTALGLTSRRVEDPAELESAITQALADRARGPVLLDIVTNPEEVSVPGKVTLQQGWGFAIAKSREILQSR